MVAISLIDINLDEASMHSPFIHLLFYSFFYFVLSNNDFGTYYAQDFVEISVKKTPSSSYGPHSLLECKNTQSVVTCGKILTKGCANPGD